MTTPRTTAAEPAATEAASFFARRLQFETDPSDVDTARRAGDAFVLLDVRGAAAWAQGRIPGALHMPHREIASRAPLELDRGTPVVAYCWGPGCNAGVKAGLALSLAGFAAKEMIGGFEYWARGGYPVEDASGIRRRRIDPLTTLHDPSLPACDC